MYIQACALSFNLNAHAQYIGNKKMLQNNELGKAKKVSLH